MDEVDLDFRHPEEILIAANEGHLVLAGRDRWDPEHLVVAGRRSTITGKQQEYGTVNAVYTFLQDYLGVRWLWPGELGTDIPQRRTVAFEPFYPDKDYYVLSSTRGTTHRQQFEAWGKLAPHLMWRPNTGSPGGWQQGLPDLSVTQTIKDLQHVANNQCIGIFIDSVWEHWATQGPQYYAMAQLVWNPHQNWQAILDDFYRRGFGPAAGHVKAYFETMERARMAHVDEHGYASGTFNLPHLYTDELLGRADEHLRLAAAEVESGPAIYGERVEFVRAGLTFTRLLVENIRSMESYWRKTDEALAGKVRGNWEAMQRLTQQHPHSINWGPVRPNTPRMLGLHPDHPNPKWKPKPADDLDLN